MNVASELRADALSTAAIPALSSGLVAGVYILIYVISASGIIFSGPLAPYFSQGTGIVLFGSFALCLVIALTGGYRGAISAMPSPAIVVLVVIGSTIGMQGDAPFMTMVAILAISALAAGACFVLIGWFRLANLVRFIPYAVASGFLAGTGGALLLAALSLMGVTIGWPMPASCLETSALWKWVPGVAYGLGLFLAIRRRGSSLLLPMSFVLCAAVFHLVLASLDISGDAAREAGLLFAGIAQGGLWPAFGPGDPARVDWITVASQSHNILALILVTLLSLVMYLGGIELAANVDLEWNREFMAAGVGSVIAGLGGGPPGCLSTSGSVISHKLRAESRLTGVVAALVMGSALLWGDAVLALIPVPLVAGILIFIGLVLLDDRLLKSHGALPWTEYAIMLLMFVTIVGFGFLEGVAIGMMVTTLFFAVRLGRVEPIEAEFTARERNSNKIRPIPDRAILREHGALVQAYRLRGYIFFGSAHPLVERIGRSLGNDPPPACILLDFSAVSGFDYSAMNALCRFIRTAHAAGTRVALSAAPRQLGERLGRDLSVPVRDALISEPDADRALERCEDIIIAARRSDPNDAPDLRDTLLERVAGDMERHLDRQIVFEGIVDDLRSWLEPREYDAGDALATIGEVQEGMQLLLAGRASVFDTAGVRLHQCGPGDAIETRAAFGAHVAMTTTVADEPCRTIVLTPSARQWLEENEERLAVNLYGYLLAVETRSAPPATAP